MINEEQPQRKLRPNVSAGTSIRGGVILLGTIALTGIFLWASEVPSLFVIIGGVMIALLGTGVVYFNLNSREYRFYRDEVEVYEGFLTINRNSTSYNRVTDISYSQPVTQRIFGTGTVKLNTAGSGYHEIKISYVDNPEQEYQTLKKIVADKR